MQQGANSMASGGSGSCAALLLLGLLPGIEPRYVAPLLASCMGPAGVAAAAGEAVLLAAALAAVAEHAWRLALQLLPGRLAGVLEERMARARERGRGLVERLGWLGLAVFVAVPLPVTGIYTGAVVAALLGLPRRRAFIGLALGGAVSALLTGSAGLAASAGGSVAP